MNVLVANLGSTSFKFRLYEMETESQVARGAVENIGGDSTITLFKDDRESSESLPLKDHAGAVQACLEKIDLNIDHANLAIGFKAVHGGLKSGVTRVNDDLLDEMERIHSTAPAHNPVYIKAMKDLRERFPKIPQVAAFETDFHSNVPDRFRRYAIPASWSDELGIQKFGFHGASHRYIAERTAEVAPECKRVISCHLGGSSSLCAIKDGQSLGATMGMSPQTGLPQSNRCGDFDAFSIPVIMRETGLSLDEVLNQLGSQSGLLGLSGKSGDMRELQEAAGQGDRDSQLAIDVYIAEIRRHLGGLVVRLGGIDAIVFTGGIGERSPAIRESVCEQLEFLGIHLSKTRNQNVEGEAQIHCPDSSQVQIRVLPTNEEIIVARQTVECLRSS